jgi:ubiquinone/menaquinone biosynthesis C-methylase UbiE
MPYWAHAYEAVVNRMPKDANVLDVGCGIGKLYRYIPGTMTYTGLDLTEHFLEIARTENPGINVVHGSALNLPFDDNEFEYAVCKDFLEHVDPDDVQVAVQEMARVASRGIIIAWFIAPSKRARYTKNPLGHITNRYEINWMKERIKNIGKDNMLNIIPIRTTQTLWRVNFIG